MAQWATQISHNSTWNHGSSCSTVHGTTSLQLFCIQAMYYWSSEFLKMCIKCVFFYLNCKVLYMGPLFVSTLSWTHNLFIRFLRLLDTGCATLYQDIQKFQNHDFLHYKCYIFMISFFLHIMLHELNKTDLPHCQCPYPIYPCKEVYQYSLAWRLSW